MRTAELTSANPLREWVVAPVLGGLAGLPLAVAAVPLVVAGRAETAARAQLRVLGPGPASGRRRVLVHSLVTLVPALAAFACAAMFVFLCFSGYLYPLRPDTVQAVAHPFSEDPGLDEAWGGPTLAGAWLVHALVALAIQAVCVLALRPVHAVQARVARKYL
ncbi:hypothetical protein [Spirillospora sp. CA-294931]|uniref:hypothetical protein n=1 Tax=Spirillospora sp. CA-294931 TaxID=3240042 RepID=UPI003D8F6414